MKLDFNCKSIDFSENKVTGTYSKSKENIGTEDKFNDKLESVDKKTDKKSGHIDEQEPDKKNIDDLDYRNLYSFLEGLLCGMTEHLNDANTIDINKLNDFIGNIKLNKSIEQGDLETIINTINSIFSDGSMKDMVNQQDSVNYLGKEFNKLEGLTDLMNKEAGNLEVKKLLDLIKGNNNEISKSTGFDNFEGTFSEDKDNFFDLLDIKKQTLITEKVPKSESVCVLEKIANLNSFNKNLNTEFSFDVEAKNNLNNLSQNNDLEVRDISGDKITSYITSTNTQQDIVGAFKYIKFNGLEQMTIRLKPDELGEMNIKLSKKDGEMIGIITVTNKSVYELVNKNTLDLKQHLESLNINIKEINVNVSDQGSQQFDLSKKDFDREKYREENHRQHNRDDKEELSTEVKSIKEENTEDRLDVLA
nr:flagellar hook-length control protein FliK [Clostridioides sp.]